MARSLQALDSIRRDLAHAGRSLAKERAFTLVCVISLGIGLGAFVALATFSRAITAPARGIDTNGLTELLVLPLGPLRAKAGEWALEQWSYPDYQALRDADIGMAITGWTREFSQFGAQTPDDAALPRVATLYVSANYFSTFGVSLARGPGFDPAVDDAPSAEPRVVLSHDFWRSRLASDPDIIGKFVTIDGVPHTVVGIAPDDFRGHFHFFQAPSSLLFIPLERHPRLKVNPNLRDDRTAEWVRIHGRLNPGVDIRRANAGVSTTVSGLAQRYPTTNEFKAGAVEPYASMGAAGRPESRRVLSVMLGLAGAVLLVVCLNISGTMLVRATRRERELSIRAALGAARQRLIQHLFFEAVWLAFAGAAISGFVLFGIPAIAGWYLGAPVPEEIDLDAVNLAIASGLCLLVSVLFGLLPAVRFSRPNLTAAMQDDAGGGGRQTIRVHRVAAMVQVGIAVPFLVISGVMLDRVRTADLGFPTDGLAAARLPVPTGPERDADFSIRRVRDNLQHADGVRSVTVAEGMPVDFDYRLFRVASTGGGEFVTAHITRVGEHFLETIGAPLLRGRTITAEDRLTAARVAVISQPLAALLFPRKEAIGERVTVTLEPGREQEFTIVGVSADFATSQLTTERPQLLLPLPDVSTGLSADLSAEALAKVEASAKAGASANAAAGLSTVHLIARGAPGDEPKLKAALESALRELGVEPSRGVAFSGIVTGQDLVDKSIGDLISESIAVGFAGGIVLVLAALGIIGVVGFMVATRTREIAVRMALGSTRLRVFGLMLSDLVKLVIPGVAGGLVLAAVLIRTMEDVMGTPLTLGPDPLGIMEPLIYAAASAIAVAAALLAGLPAARRATVVQPMVAIRSE
ncbi:MAG TPA: ABC transporter permease [Vicinamibacterales bacterium]|nr:ABC transporter permease [Vicinamibacterales bacterium]